MSNRIKAARLAAEVTQTRLAQQAGISQSTLSHIETSKAVPSDLTIAKLAHALGLSYEDLS